MHPSFLLLSGVATLATAASIPALQSPLGVSHHKDVAVSGFRIPTVHESAIMARRMLHKAGVATFATIFPSSHSPTDDIHVKENRPDDVGGKPFALFEYIADCEPDTGNPTILAVDIATTFRNERAGSNVSMTVEWVPPAWREGTYSPARLPRFNLMGYLEAMDDATIKDNEIKECFLKKHKDVIWAPGNDIHTSRWVRFVVREVYWFGGFGDRARIQWIPIEEWRSITMEEVHNCRLPGDEETSSSMFSWLKNDVKASGNTCPANY